MHSVCELAQYELDELEPFTLSLTMDFEGAGLMTQLLLRNEVEPSNS